MQTINPPDTNVAHYPRLMYYYHASTPLSAGPDYLGHVEYITDLDGAPLALSEVEVYQHFYYTAWGETLLDQKATRPGMNFDSPYRFNGKELDDETGLYYYGARYYNPTVSVWLGVDRLAHKYPSMTPYNFSGNNPILFVDPNGDSLNVALNAETIDDAFSIVNQENQGFLNIGMNGAVSLDFCGLNEDEQNKVLDGDVGLCLLNDLINAEENYFYETGDNSQGQTHDGRTLDINYSVDKNNNQRDFIVNLSITPRNNDGGLGTRGVKPLFGDGYVRISPGGFERKTSTGIFSIPRSSIIFHELAESFNRTTNKQPYIRHNGTGAHQNAITREGTNYTPHVDGPVIFRHR